MIFCLKLGDYKGGKVTESDFWKKFLIWRLIATRLEPTTTKFVNEQLAGPVNVFLYFGILSITGLCPSVYKENR